MDTRNRDSQYNRIRRRVFDIIQIGNMSDVPSTVVDIILAAAIVFNISAVFLETFDKLEPYYGLFTTVEYVTVVIFTIEYILRLWTADFLFPDEKYLAGSELRFIFSITGLVDLCCFLPFYLPFVFPAGIVAFRILRVLRIFRLLRINAYYDAFNVITDVINDKKNQLLSAVFIIMILILASSLIMYNLEHEAQPEAFKNAFSGIWWSVSTMLTVGYGDIYPVTLAGQITAIVMAFLGVGLVAIPTGIISAGFVERWSRIKDGLATEKSEFQRTNGDPEHNEILDLSSILKDAEAPCGETSKIILTLRKAGWSDRDIADFIVYTGRRDK